MIRVLFVTTSTTVGGAEKTVYTLATLLDPAKFRVVGVVSLKPFGAFAHKLGAAGFPTFSLGLEGAPGLAQYNGLRQIIDETRPDVVHAVMYQAIQLCRVVKGRVPVPFKLLSSPRVNYRSRSFATLAVDRFLKGKDDLLVSESEASKKFLTTWLGYPAPKVKVIYNGVDVAGWPASRLERQQKRLELRLASDELLFGAAGRLDEQKGHRYLIEAMHRLKGQPVRLVILGNGPARGELEGLIRKWRLEKQVWLLGERDDMPTWLSSLDAFVLPSLWEGLPNALLEAMALGLPVVASNVDGVGEVVKHDQNGLLCRAKDPAALSHQMLRLINDASLRAKLGAAAKQTVLERFGLIEMMTRYQETYAHLVGR
jgi:glycosyltransferase involved in cell wall biosynthesis